MKNIFNKLLLLIGLAIFVSACEKDDDFATLNPDAVLTATASKTAVVLVKDDLGKNALTVTWTAPEYGFSAAPVYRVLLDVKGNNFSKAYAVTVGTNLQKTFKTEELNKILLNLGIKAKTATFLDVKVESVLSPSTIISSSILSLNATAYTDILDLSTPWGVVGSATPGSWNGPDLPFYQTTAANIIVAYVTLVNGEIKFRMDNSWTVNYGDDGANGSLEAGGANMVVSAGTYKITFNTTSLTYTIEALTWGLVGSATTNGWDGPDMKLTYDPFTDQWRAVVYLKAGELKIRKNNSWDLNYGDDGANGTLEQGGANIVVTAGWYLVSVNLTKLEYTVEKTNVWGIVGSAAPNGWDGPNVKFVPDYSREGYFLLKGVTLIDGEFKFRQNDSWDVNYGDNGNDGTLESGGANIPITAGIYDFVLDFSAPSAPKYTKVKKS
ncbi:MAG: SusE domain-containing protein [Flavobacteriaceae bacterium]|nr:SusE domain-containing protein [Flavobacteriaceae bacterium]